MSKPVITLFDSRGLGLIVECPSGVLYANQVGGTACLRRLMEGVFAPCDKDHLESSLEDQFTAYFLGPKHAGTGATSGLDSEDMGAIDTILDSAGLGDWLQVDRGLAKQSCEAWVYVPTLADEGAALPSTVTGFGPHPRRGVLTWSNSD